MNLFGGVKSVSEILKSFEKVVADLTAVKVHHTSEMARHKQVIADAQTAHDASSTEAGHADAVVAKIKALISPETVTPVTPANPS